MPTTTPEIIDSASAIIQALSTIVLVVITALQIGEARKSVKSMERSIMADFLPVLMMGLIINLSTDKTLSVRLVNCGKGLARKPKVIFPGQPDITINSLNVQEEDNVTVEYKTDYILKKIPERERKIIVEYHDVFGRKIVTEANLIAYNKLGPSNDIQGVGWESWTPIIP